MRLSRHFRQKWIDFFGYEPDEASIKQMIEESFVVQEFKRITTRDGKPFNVVRICWHLPSNILFKIDDHTHTAITFVTDRKLFGGGYARQR